MFVLREEISYFIAMHATSALFMKVLPSSLLCFSYVFSFYLCQWRIQDFFSNGVQFFRYLNFLPPNDRIFGSVVVWVGSG
ncbi:hypothetical protein HanRHA438_Chr16g0766371 [Helianthus annuus]|nr:hypothetical protein HanRHA438_Chr16g0766371 [Helianthus annuus]